ncbi:YjbQ family protein [Patescibacteria group bacterium]|nr:YjbQ family protein [Patescibacteria group bacterium]
MHQLTITTTKHKEIVDITEEVNSLIQKQSWEEGICHLFVKHTTAALTTADLDPGTDLDMLDAFEEMIPKLKYRHPHDPSHVGDHIMSSLIGPSVTMPVQNGKLQLGTWQRVVLIEFYGPRERTILASFTKLQ